MAFSNGDSSTGVQLPVGVHMNLTTLNHWNYTYYSNKTLSNDSNCVLFFQPFTPKLLSNGTFVNSTSCYASTEPMRMRSTVGLALTCLFAIFLVSTVFNLRKHGKAHFIGDLPHSRTGQRMQWYWMMTVSAFAFASGITAIDIDRCYLPELPIVLSGIFWFLMVSATMATVWESVRHWGSWLQRQVIDENPLLMRRCRRKQSNVELCLPIIFYICLLANFFLIVPRAWTDIEKQHSEEQTAMLAEPTATDIRFKLASFFLLACWFITICSLWYSNTRYVNREGRPSCLPYFTSIPPEFRWVIPIALIMVCYEVACSFIFSISPLSLKTELGIIYGLGWGVPFIIIFGLSYPAWFEENEDLYLEGMRKRRDFKDGHYRVCYRVQ